MKFRIISFLALTVLIMSSCKSTKNYPNIPSIKAERYFVKNTVKDGSALLLRFVSQEKLDEYFGAAAVMGKDGKPSQIDFDKQYAIAVILPTTDYNTTISAYNLQETEDRIVLNYKVNKGNKQSFSVRPYLLLIVDQKYNKDIRFNPL